LSRGDGARDLRHENVYKIYAKVSRNQRNGLDLERGSKRLLRNDDVRKGEHEGR